MKKVLAGVLPPVVTPFSPDAGETLDLDGFRANLRAWNRTGLSGYLVLGSNGETVYLTEREKEEVLAAAREAAAPEKILMAGTGCESTRATVELTRLAAKHGADCALVLTPAYYKSQMTPAALETHYRRVADAAPIPILLYNVPQFTGINLSATLVARLAEHPNIVGIKDSSGNLGQLGEIVRQTPEDFAVFVGSAPVFYPALCVGAVGGILAVANVLPERWVELFERFRSGDHPGALALQRDLTPLAAAVTATHGVGGLKIAMTLRGYVGGAVRGPLVSPEGARAELEAELVRLGETTTERRQP